MPDIAKQLGVTNILEGSVQKANDQVRVNVQLINALTDAHLWAEIYDRKLTDIFAVESDIAKTIADTLQAKLTGSESTAISQTSRRRIPKPMSFISRADFSGTNALGEDLTNRMRCISSKPSPSIRNYATGLRWPCGELHIDTVVRRRIPTGLFSEGESCCGAGD